MLRALLPTLAILLLFAGSAAAECAWVLWSTAMTKSIRYENTLPARGYKTRDECERELDRRQGREEARRREDPDTEYFFLCLPDTIDPRGPKGAGR